MNEYLRVCDLIEQEKKLSIIECPICMETYDIPLFCPCGHTLCSKCFEKLKECPYDKIEIKKEEGVWQYLDERGRPYPCCEYEYEKRWVVEEVKDE